MQENALNEEQISAEATVLVQSKFQLSESLKKYHHIFYLMLLETLEKGLGLDLI
jgi:hypothetical protein